MRTIPRLAVLAFATLVAVAVGGAAFAAGPTFRDRDSWTDTDTNFCGTGETVLIEGRVVSNVWIGTTGGDREQELRATMNLQIRYTNPETGAAVVEQWAVMRTNEIISGLESGVHTHEITERGHKATLRLVGGGVLTRDAGSLTYRLHFDENDNVTDFEIVAIRGPHPAFQVEGDWFCDTIVPALGLD